MRILLIMIYLATPAVADQRTDEICRLFASITGDSFAYQTEINTALGSITQEAVVLLNRPDADASAMAPLISELQKAGKIVERLLANTSRTKRDLARVHKLCAS